MTDDKITRDHLEAKFRAIQGDVDQKKEDAQGTIKIVIIGAAVFVVVLAFVLGSRRGKRKTTIVEIRRF